MEEQNASEASGLSEVDLSRPEQADDVGDDRQPHQDQTELPQQQHQQLEFFDSPRARDSGAESGEGEGSPGQGVRDKDADSMRGAFITLSPPVSPVGGPLSTDDIDPSLLQSLEDSTSSSDIPKSKLDRLSQDSKKMLDFEVPVAGPGKKRTLDREEGGSIETEGQSIDLKVSITEREKQGVKQDPFFSYKICTDTTRPTHLFENSHYEVWRRYRDFEWLREMMEKHHPTLITPPLPGKQVTRYFDQHSEEFLDERQRALDTFLKRLTAHPYFSFDDNLKVFLTAETMTFANHIMKTSGSNRLLSSVTTSVKHAATSFRLKTPDPYFAKESKYFSTVGEKLGVVERVVTRLHQEREELIKTMEDFSSAADRWCILEQQPLSQSIKKLGSCMENCSSAVTSLNTANSFSLLMASKEYQLFTASGVSAIRRRDGLQLEMERTSEDKERKKKIHDEAASAGKLQKLPKLADDLQKSSVMADRALDSLSQANEELRVDIDKWKEAKDREINRLMRKVSDDHINFHQKCFDEWAVVLKLLKNIDEADSSENGDSPEHRKRDISQSESVEPSTSLVSDDLLLNMDSEKGKTDDGEKENGDSNMAERGAGGGGRGVGNGDGSSSGKVQLPGLFDEEDAQTNDLFNSSS